MKQGRKINVNRRLSREVSLGNSSLGDYHRESPASVPFIWESEPGTPKHKFHERTPLPPLTPPPSYQYNSNRRSSTSASSSPSFYGASRQSKPGNLIHTIFPRISSRKGTYDVSSSSPNSSPWSSQWSSSSSSERSLPRSMPSSPAVNRRGRHAPNQEMSFDLRGEVEEEEDEYDETVPVSTLCYKMGGGGANRGLYRGCCSAVMKMLKK